MKLVHGGETPYLEIALKYALKVSIFKFKDARYFNHIFSLISTYYTSESSFVR